MALITRETLEWARSSVAAESGFDDGKTTTFEKMWRKQVDFVKRVEMAFSDVTLGTGIGLFEANGIDDGFDLERQYKAREKDERDSWTALSEGDLSYGRSALCFTDSDGFRFLIPAFMLADLTGDLDDSVVIHLSHTRDDQFNQFSSMNWEQIETVVDFLELFLDDPDEHFHHDAITEALMVFWRPLLEQRRQAQVQE